jgi:hypothetical protein
MWNCHRSTDNRYSGDNRLIGLESSHRQPGLAPQHLGCSGGNVGNVLANNGGAHKRRVIPWEVLQNARKR